MEISVPGFIHNYCTPNAMLTLTEYLVDYASEKVKIKGWKAIEENQNKIKDQVLLQKLRDKIRKIMDGERDLYF
jgi:2-iminoacetate synthase